MIINLTQHAASPEQLAAGVVEPNPGHKRIIADALTFDQIPDRDEMVERAAKILALVQVPGGGCGNARWSPLLHDRPARNARR